MIIVAGQAYSSGVKFEWDESKRRSNVKKHGIDFADLPDLFKGATLTIQDDRFDYGEIRFITLGLLRSCVVAVAHTETETTIRIISARKATRNEAKQYFQAIGN